MAIIEISNTFLVMVIVGYIVFRLICDFNRETHLRPQRPSEIHFTTSIISSDLTSPNGARASLKSFIDELTFHGDALAMAVDPIRIYYDANTHQWQSLDNRRLYALRKAEQHGAVSLVRYIVDTPPSLTQDVARNQFSKNRMDVIPVVQETPGFEWNATYNLTS